MPNLEKWPKGPEEKEILEIDRNKLVEEEETILSKFRGKAGLMARAFVLLTFLAASKPIEKAVIKGEHIKEPEKVEQVYKQEQLSKEHKEFLALVEKSPSIALTPNRDRAVFRYDYGSEYEHTPDYSELPKGVQETVQQAIEDTAEEYSLDILNNISVYKKLPNKEKIIQRAVEAAAQEYPDAALIRARDYKGRPYTKEVIKTAAENSPGAALELVQFYGNVLGSKETTKLILEAAEKAIQDYPRKVLSYIGLSKDYLKKSQIQELTERAIKNNPGEAVALLERTRDKDIQEILQKSKDPAIKVFLDIYNSDSYSSPLKKRMVLLLQEISSGNIPLNEAAEIGISKQRLFSSLIDIKKQPNHLAENQVEDTLSSMSLHRVYNINDLHNEPDEKRFQSVKNANAEELYTLMTYGEEEIFTSSFNGLFDRLLERMKKENISGDQLLEKIGHNKFRTFIKLNTDFNRLNDFLATMDKDLQKDLLEGFAKGIDKERNKLSQAVVVADTFSMVRDPEILKVFQHTIKKEHENIKEEGDKEAKIIYGLLAGMFSKKAVTSEAWIKEMSEKYKLPDLIELSSSELFNQDKTNIQQHFFYDDKDGRASFQNFLAQYRDKSGWKIEEKDNYVLVRASKGDKTIEIYANKPAKQREGPEEIEKILKEKNIQTIVVVHRGHSYHLKETIEGIPPIAKIVSLGSCGGYSNIDAILKKASGAHIISTKGTGTMFVNDPLLKMLNNEILSGKNINWPEFWAKTEKRLGKNKNFGNYIPPHENLGVLFLKAYNKIVKG